MIPFTWHYVQDKNRWAQNRLVVGKGREQSQEMLTKGTGGFQGLMEFL